MGHFPKQKERGGVCAPPAKVAVMVWAVVVSSSSLSSRLHWPHRHANALVKELETGRERERRRRREGRLQGQRANPILLTTNQSGGVLRCLGGSRGGRQEEVKTEEEISTERRRVGGLQGGSPGSIIRRKEVL